MMVKIACMTELDGARQLSGRIRRYDGRIRGDDDNGGPRLACSRTVGEHNDSSLIRVNRLNVPCDANSTVSESRFIRRTSSTEYSR